MQVLWLPAIRAQLALREKNPTSALRTPQPASPVELGETPFGNNISCLYPVYTRGGAYLAAGQGAAAASEFQKILEHSGIVWNCWTGALAHLGVARANALQANTSQGADVDAARVRALAAYRHFLAIWKDADPEKSKGGVCEAAVISLLSALKTTCRSDDRTAVSLTGHSA
jgi:eukaryotic-like serine/threonine-protein kinase